jgi:hypothetical protein
MLKMTAEESGISMATTTPARFATTADKTPGRKWKEVAQLVVCLAAVVSGGRRNRIEVTSKMSELSSFLKKFDTRFRSKSELPVTFQVFSDHLSQKKPKRSEKIRKPGFDNNIQIKHRRADRQDKALEIENNRQTVVSVKDAMIKRTMIPIRCDGEHDHGVLLEPNQPRSTRRGRWKHEFFNRKKGQNRQGVFGCQTKCRQFYIPSLVKRVKIK